MADPKQCPFCLSEVPGEATRCRHCAGDFTVSVDSPDFAGFWIVGIILTVIGLVVAAGSDGGDGTWIGLIIAGVGGVLIQIVVIAYGVSVGMRDHEHRKHVKRYANVAALAKAE